MSTNKINRNKVKAEIKMLVKECMLEVLTESFIERAITKRLDEIVAHTTKTVVQPIIESKKRYVISGNIIPDIKQHKSTNNRNKQSLHDTITLNNDNVKHQQTAPKNQEKVIIDALGVQDNVMRNIFEDTAKTTVHVQDAAGHVRPTQDGIQYQGSTTDIDIDIFNGAGNWAKISGLE